MLWLPLLFRDCYDVVMDITTTAPSPSQPPLPTIHHVNPLTAPQPPMSSNWEVV